jgi:2'-5' RNA ligase
MDKIWKNKRDKQDDPLITEGNDGGDKGYLGVHWSCNEEKHLKTISEFIKEEDLYEEFGIEEEAHVTVLYGFDPSVKKKDIKLVMEDKCIFHKDIEFTGISLFENNEYDVIKLDVESEKLREYNNFFSENFPYESNFPDYVPHVTIAYVKKGKGKYYVSGHTGKDLMEVVVNSIKNCPLYYKFSDSEKKETLFSIVCDDD